MSAFPQMQNYTDYNVNMNYTNNYQSKYTTSKQYNLNNYQMPSFLNNDQYQLPRQTQNQNNPQIRSSKQIMDEFKQLLSQTNTLYEQFNTLEKQISPSKPQTPSAHQLIYGNSNLTSNRPSINPTNNNNVLFYETNEISHIRPSSGLRRVTRGQSISNILNQYEPLPETNNIDIDNVDNFADIDVITSPLDDNINTNIGVDVDTSYGDIHNNNNNNNNLFNNVDSNNSSINLDDIANEIQDYYNSTDHRTQQAKRIQEEISKIKVANQVLTRSNIDLQNENKKLENEIETYKTNGILDKSKTQNKQHTTEYDINLGKFLDNLKSSLNENIEKNLTLMNQINDMITQNQKLFEENMQLEGHYDNMVNQYEYSNKRNAETQTFDK